MAINKVVYGGDTLIDLTSDTVIPPKLKIGAVAHAANGSAIEGELAGVYYGETAPSPSDSLVWIKPDGDVDEFVKTSDVKYKIYKSVTDLGLTSGSAVIVDAYVAMPRNTILLCSAEEFASTELPSGFAGTIEIVRGANSYRGWINLYGDIASRGDWRMYINSGVPTGTWIRNDAITETATPTASSGTLITGSKIRRSGNTVVLNFGASGVDVETSITQIGSIPSEYAPSGDAVFGVGIIGFGAGTVYADVTNAGVIRIRGNSAQSNVAIRFQLVWTV